jgi:hypothetical protein
MSETSPRRLGSYPEESAIDRKVSDMSRVREPFRHLRETLREALRQEDEAIRPDQSRRAPQFEDSAPHEGPEIPDKPMGVPAADEHEDQAELPGFPQTDPTHG